jgi:hypothetical protein
MEGRDIFRRDLLLREVSFGGPGRVVEGCRFNEVTTAISA